MVVWSADALRAARVAKALRKGAVWINDSRQLRAEAEQGGYRPHGGEPLRGFTAGRRIYRQAGPA